MVDKLQIYKSLAIFHIFVKMHNKWVVIDLLLSLLSFEIAKEI